MKGHHLSCTLRKLILPSINRVEDHDTKRMTESEKMNERRSCIEGEDHVGEGVGVEDDLALCLDLCVGIQSLVSPDQKRSGRRSGHVD